MNSMNTWTKHLSRPFKTYSTALATHSSTAKFENHPYDLHLTESPPVLVEVTKEDALEIFSKMSTIRKMENQAAQLYQRKLILGFCHLYAGQEACAVGVRSIVKPADDVITTYRCHAWGWLMGEPLGRIFGELLGKVTGSCRGKGGSMHIYAKGFYGGNGIVGSPTPLGTGLALAHQSKGDGGVSFVVLGDGAMDQGQTHEAFNFAKLHALPVVYIVENNGFSMGTSSVRHSANTDLYKRGDLIPGIRLDGMDVFATREASKFAVEHVRNGRGPILLEFLTYRYYGHSMSDPGTSYRTREEVQSVRENRDCIKLLSEKMVKFDLATEQELKNIEKEIQASVESAVEKVLKDNAPGVEELTADVYKASREKIRMSKWDEYVDHKNVEREAL